MGHQIGYADLGSKADRRKQDQIHAWTGILGKGRGVGGEGGGGGVESLYTLPVVLIISQQKAPLSVR